MTYVHRERFSCKHVFHEKIPEGGLPTEPRGDLPCGNCGMTWDEYTLESQGQLRLF